MFLITVSSLYFGAEPDLYLRGVRRIVPDTYRSIFEDCLISVTKTVRAWLLARLLSMTAIGALISCGLFSIGVPLAGTWASSQTCDIRSQYCPNSICSARRLTRFCHQPNEGHLHDLAILYGTLTRRKSCSPLVDRGIVKLPPSLTLTVQLLLGLVAGALGVALAAPLTAVALSILTSCCHLRSQSPRQRLSSANCHSAFKLFDNRSRFKLFKELHAC